MRGLVGPILLLGLIGAGAAMAGPPETALRPEARPGQEAPVAEPTQAGLSAVPRPRARTLAAEAVQPAEEAQPPAEEVQQATQAEEVQPSTEAEPRRSPLAVLRVLLPKDRPARVTEEAAQARAQQARGQVCGDPAIQGEAVAAVQDGGGCGIENPVLVRSIDGVALSEPSLMDCVTAQALLYWTRVGARPAIGRRGGGLAGFEVMGHYVCRPRNNQAGERLSEHGRGHAIDIGALVLADGSRLAVAGDWPDPALRQMHDTACGIFSTTLGPGSDGFHEDHLHYDTARGRGAYCR